MSGEVTVKAARHSAVWRHRARRWGRTAAVGSLVISGLTVATAGNALAAPEKASVPGTPASQSAPGKAGPSAAASNPIGSKVTIVSSGFNAPAGSQTFGSVTCPGTKQPAGGGVVIASSDLGANINSSWPNGSSWQAWVNNNTGANTTFSVYAVCAPPNAKYTVVSKNFTNPANVQSSASVKCPLHTRVRGGGVFSNSISLLVNINSTLPAGNGWRADMNNATGSDQGATVYAICANKPTGYTLVIGTPVANPANTESLATASCPSGSPHQLGGGGFSSSGSTSVNMNSTYPTGSGWGVFENNATANNYSLTAYVYCIA